MNLNARDFCFKAMAYLKAEVAPGQGRAVPLHGEHSPVLRRLDNGLLVAYLVDQGQHFSYVQGRHLRDGGVSPQELHAQAVGNLATYAEQHVDVHEYGKVFASIGGAFQASMLLCSDFWDIWYARLAPGGFIAAIPARNVLAFGDIDEADTVAELCALYEQGRPWRDHPVSASLFRRIGTDWRPLHADAMGTSPRNAS